MSLLAGLARLIEIRPAEREPVLLLTAFAFCMGLAQVYLSSVAISLFLGSFGAAMLPFGYIGIGLSLPVVGWLHGRLEQRLDLPRLVMMNLLLMALSLLLWRWLIELPWRGWLLILYVWWVVVWSILNLALWGLVGRIFDLRQSKRLNGVVGAGEVLAMVLGGISVAFLVQPLGVTNLLLLSVAAIAMGLLVLGRLSNSQRERLQQADTVAELAGDSGVLEQFKNRYLRLVFANSALAWLVFYVIDNAFFSLAGERYPDEAAMAGLVGQLDATVGVLLLFSRLLLSSRLLSWFGVRGGLLAIPLVVGSGSLAVVLSAHLGASAGLIFGLAMMVKVSEDVCRDSIFRSTLQVLFQPLSPTRRLRAQVTTESLVDPMAAALAALLLLLLASSMGFSAVRLFQVLIGVFVIWAILAWTSQQHYLSSLRRALARRAATGGNAESLEGASSEILQQALYSDFPSEIAYALEALRRSDPQQLRLALPRLLGHTRAEVRCLALDWVAREPQAEVEEELRRLAWYDAHPRVRGLALRALAAASADGAIEVIAAALQDPHEEVRAGAVVGLIGHGGIQGILLAGNELLAQSISPDPDRRRWAAAVVGEIGNATFYHPLLTLLADPQPGVVMVALQAAAKLRSPALWPAVLPALDRPELRGYAIEALRAGGRSAAQAVAARIGQAQITFPQQTRLLRVLGVIDDDFATTALLDLIDCQNRELRAQVLAALVRQPRKMLSQQLGRLQAQIDLELADAAWLLGQICACRADGEMTILSPLREQLVLVRKRLLMLLQLSLDSHSMAQVRDRIEDGSAERRAYALELLENLLPGELKQRLLPHFETLGEAACLASLKLPAENPIAVQERRLQLESIAEQWGCHWLQASAICALDADPLAASRVELRKGDGGSLINQAAQWWLLHAQKQASAAQKSELDWQFGGSRRVGLLREVGIFADAGESVLARMAERLSEFVVKRGEIIVDQDAAGRSLHVIAAGSVGVHLKSINDPRQLRRVATLHAPEIFGEFSLVDAGPRSALVRADTQARLYRLEFEDFYEMLFDYPEITRRLIRLLGERLRSQSSYGLAAPSATPIGRSEASSSGKLDDEAVEAMVDPLRCRLLLQTVPMLADLPEPLIATIAVNLRPLRVRAGERIYAEGELGRTVYLIAAGRIRQHRGEQILIERGARDLFGDFSILDPQPHLSSASAVQESLLLRLDKELLQELLMLWPELARNLLRDLVQRNRASMRLA